MLPSLQSVHLNDAFITWNEEIKCFWLACTFNMPHRCRSPIKNDNQGASNTDRMQRNDANWSEGCTALAVKGALCRRGSCALCLVPCSACCTLKQSKQNGHEELTTCKLAQKKLRFLAQTCAACQKLKAKPLQRQRRECSTQGQPASSLRHRAHYN